MSQIETVRKDIYCIDAFYGAPRHGAVYVVRDQNEVAIIDTGTALSTIYVMDALQRLDIHPQQVRYILPTHVHLDHAGGAAPLSRQLPQATVIVHPFGLKHLIEPTKLIQGSLGVYGKEMMEKTIGEIEPLAADRGKEAEDGMRLALGKRHLQLLFSPGHAKHHYSVWDEASGCYFAGDIAGNSYREMDKDGKHLMFLCSAPTQYDPDAWRASLDQIAAINPQLICLCHYGVLNHVDQAIADMQRLIEDNNREVMQCPTNTKAEVEKAVWRMFWQEYERLEAPMARQHAQEWMVKDVYIATGGLFHWRAKQEQDSS